MPIKSFSDIDRMLSAFNQPRKPKTFRDSSASFYESGAFHSSSSPSPSSSYSSDMSRSYKVMGSRDIFDENGYFNSSRQLIK
jgi:hypothetical protein